MFLLSSINLKAQEAILLKKGDLSPYNGILAPHNYIRDLERRSTLMDFYKSEVEKNKDCLPELSAFEPDTAQFWEGTVVGAALSFLIVTALIR